MGFEPTDQLRFSSDTGAPMEWLRGQKTGGEDKPFWSTSYFYGHIDRPVLTTTNEVLIGRFLSPD